MNSLSIRIEKDDLVRVTENEKDTIFEVESYESDSVVYTRLGKNEEVEMRMDEFVDWIQSADAVKIRHTSN